MARPILLALVLLASLVVPASAHAQGADPDGPTYQMPAVGACLQMTLIDYLLMAPKIPVDCATEHTAVVTAVAVLPEDTDWTVGSDDLKAAEDQYCMPAFYETLGGNFTVIAKTAYLWRYAIPNEEQRSHGASWFRCDLNMSGAIKYLPLPNPLLAGTRVPRRITSCILRLGEAAYSSTCTDAYNYRFEKVLVLPGETYPTPKAVGKFAKKHCPKGKKDRAKWWYRWSFEPAWEYGDHTLVCYRAV